MIDFLLHVVSGLIGGSGFAAWLLFRKTKKRLAWYGILAFLLASAYLASLEFVAWDIEQFFVSLGNWQSIFSSGTATLAVILYIVSRFRPEWRKGILQSFLLIFKVIWVGFAFLVISELGLLRHSVTFIQSLSRFPPFIFGQILIAVIMLNGVYIGKRIGFGLIMLLKQEPIQAPPPPLARRIAVSGSLSIVSWYFLLAAHKGLFGSQTLFGLFMWYVGAIVAAIIANIIFESLIKSD